MSGSLLIMEGVAPLPRMGSCILARMRMRQGRQKQRTGSMMITWIDLMGSGWGVSSIHRLESVSVVVSRWMDGWMD